MNSEERIQNGKNRANKYQVNMLACVFIESIVYTKTDFVYKIC